MTDLIAEIQRAVDRKSELRLLDAVATGDNTVTVGQSTVAVTLPAIIPVVSGDFCQVLEQGANRVIVGPVGKTTGLVGTDTGSVATVGTTMTDVGATVEWTADTGHVYVVYATARATPTNTANRCVVILANGANTELARLVDTGSPTLTGGNGSLIGAAQHVITGSSGVVSVKLRTSMVAGTAGTVDTTGTVTVLAFPAS